MTRSRLVRLIDRDSRQCITEVDLTGLSPSQVDTWYLRVCSDGVLKDCLLEWPDSTLEDS